MTDLVLKQFIFCVLSNLIYWNFNVFAFSAVVIIHLTHYHSGVNTELTIAENLFFGQKFLVSSSHGVLYIDSVKTTFGHWSSDCSHKITEQPCIENSKITGLKDCKSCQENVSLSLAKRKLAKKNEWKFSNQ